MRQDFKKESVFLNKLPHITAAFWFMKISATTLGETGGDWLSMTMNFGYKMSMFIFLSIFVITLLIQLLSQKHTPLIYWSVIIATSTAGTTISDYLDRTLNFGYTKGVLILVTLLLLILGAWKWTMGTISVNEIKSRRAEGYYWFTILISNTLGTALGDFLSDDSGLGFLGSWLLITTVLIFILALYALTRTDRILLFWIAFVLTRPFGATFGDVLTKSSAQGGFELGRGSASLVLLGILLVTILACYKKSDKGNAVLIY